MKVKVAIVILFLSTFGLCTKSIFAESQVSPNMTTTPSAQFTSFYIEITTKNIKIQNQPTPNAAAHFYTWKGIIFEVINQTDTYYQINLLDGDDGWILKSSAKTLDSNHAPPIELFAISLPIKKKVAKKTIKQAIAELNEQFNPKLLSPDKDHFIFPRKNTKQYPDISVSGQCEVKVSGRDYTPKAYGTPLWDTIRNDPIYKKLPNDVLVGDPKFEIRYDVHADGQLAEDLSVRLHVEQEPDFPGRYDVAVKHKNSKLSFGHLETSFKNGEFVDIKKAIDGVTYENSTSEWETTLATGRQKSEPQKFESWGNNKKEVQVGRSYLLEGSVEVYVNNKKLSQGTDYEVNHFDGIVTFTSIKGPTDYIEIIYEFTNPIEDFIPALSRKNFLGAQYKWRAKTEIKETKQISDASEQFQISKFSSSNIDLKTFPLAHSPVVLGSVTLKFNDRILKKNKDYFIRHHEGQLKFHEDFPLQDDDKVHITYSYYQIGHITENLVGNDSPGPYLLSHKNIIPKPKLYLKNRQLQETIDYIFNYDDGRIQFNYPISYPDIITADYSYIKIKTTSENASQSPMRFGVSYLSESVRAEDEKIILKITSENVIQQNNYSATTNIVTTIFNPILVSENIEIYIDGEQISSADYTIENAYKGEIKLDPNKHANVNNMLINYSYRKSFQSMFIFIINQGLDGAWYRNNISSGFILRETPMKHGGISYIDVLDPSIANSFTPIRLEAGKEFEIDYGSDGEDIAIRFLTDKDNKASQLPKYPQPGARVTIHYEYTPKTSPSPGNMHQQLIGITAGTNLSENWEIDTEIAAADYNFEKPQIEASKLFNGVGTDGHWYSLDQRNLVEDSESVFINNQGLTKDIDYIINYINGKIRFINLTPGPEDEINVGFKHYDASGQTTAGEMKGAKLATKVSTQYQTDTLMLKGDFKSIDKDFVSLSPIKEKKGTTTFGGEALIKLNDYENIAVNIRHWDELKSEKDGESIYLHQNDMNASTKISVFDDALDMSHSLRIFNEKDDQKKETNTNTIDNDSLDYTGKFDFGPAYFRNSIIQTLSQKTNHKNQTDDATAGFNYNSRLSLNKVHLLGDILIDPSFDFASTKHTNRVQLDSSGNITVSENIQSTTRKEYKLNTSIKPHHTLSAKFDYQHKNILSDNDLNPSSNSETQFNNMAYRVSYKPYSWIQTSFNRKREETESPLLSQQGKVTDKSSFGIDRFSIFGLLEELGLRDFLLASPFKDSYLKYHQNETNTNENNDKKQFGQDGQTVSYENFIPIKGVTIKKVSYETRETDSLLLIPTETTSKNISTSAYEKKEGNMNVHFDYPILKWFTYDISMAEQKDSRTNETKSFFSTSNIVSDEQPEYTQLEKLTFNPGSLYLGHPDLMGINLGTFSAGLERYTSEKINSSNTLLISPAQVSQLLQQLHDDRYLYRDTLTGSYSPFNLFKLDGKISSENEIYRRTTYDGDNLITYKRIDDKSLSGAYSPFSFISFTGNIAHNALSQYRSPSTNISLNSLKLAQANHDATSFKDAIIRSNKTYSLGTTIKPFSFISIRGSGARSTILESFLTSDATSSSNYTQTTVSVGSALHLLKGLEISYDYTLSKTRSLSAKADQEGYTGAWRISYKPIENKTFKVNILYTRSDNWGFNFNTLDQSISEQGSGDTMQTIIEERKDTVGVLSLIVDITIPIQTSPYVDRFVISGEGHFKQVEDHMDYKKEQPNSFSVGGAFIKGTLYF